MDPLHQRVRDGVQGLPRARGDGPLLVDAFLAVWRASPRPRGWTRRSVEPCAVESGFPAPAGMDPRECRSTSRRTRLPRARGDGPRSRGCNHGASGASPRPRGWTLVDLPPGQHRVGFPAPAGMDPRGPPGHGPAGGLPRARGDGPQRGRADVADEVASPRPRGWTAEAALRVETDPGFPAPAGMDPNSRSRYAPAPRLPRARGDGPVRAEATDAMTAASPRPRGWTFRGAPFGSERYGFPAPAGMDPRPRVRVGRLPGLPRARGDGPPT